jgi:ribose 5-phosphate isomerase A
LPVEVVPFAVSLSSRLLEQIGLPPRIRTVNDMPFISDNHNYILDCQVGPITDPAGLNHSLCALPGVVDTGLFVGMADLVLVQDGPHVQVLEL